MSAFDKVIGYQGIKDELLQICDMYQNKDVYTKLGAELPHGMLLYGDPGLGKTLMCKAFIEECGIYAVTVRKTSSGDEFVKAISQAFEEAYYKAPAIVFLDDMDKFANEDANHVNAPEYVTVQACIDEYKGRDVFVLATANDIDNLPESLLRAGRFDRHYRFTRPNGKDAEEIISYYMSSKSLADDVNYTDISKMIHYSSCAELEEIINEAAIRAGHRRSDKVGMQDLVDSILGKHYTAHNDYSSMDEKELRKIATHEAGHLVVSELLVPESVGFVSIDGSDVEPVGGFVHVCKRQKRRPHEAMLCLAGKVATELYYAYPIASGCGEDIDRAMRVIEDGIIDSASHGFGLSTAKTLSLNSSDFKARTEAVTSAEIEKLYQQTKQLLLDNRTFLENIIEALVEKRVLLFSDIQAIKQSCGLVNEAA